MFFLLKKALKRSYQMCIPPSTLSKIADSYEKKGNQEEAALQRRSNEKWEKVIKSRSAIQNQQQNNNKNLSILNFQKGSKVVLRIFSNVWRSNS